MSTAELVAEQGVARMFHLPFEVHFHRIPTLGYEILVDPTVPQEIRYETALVEVTHGRIAAVFRAEGQSPGELLSVLKREIVYAPDWVQWISQDDMVVKQSTRYSLNDLDPSSEQSDQDEDARYANYVGDKSLLYFSWEDGLIDCLILDADGQRIRVDHEGYEVNETGVRTGVIPMISIDRSIPEEAHMPLRDGKAVRSEVQMWIKQLNH